MVSFAAAEGPETRRSDAQAVSASATSTDALRGLANIGLEAKGPRRIGNERWRKFGV